MTEFLGPHDFYRWLRVNYPELVPPGFEVMKIDDESLNLIGRQVGFRTIYGHDLKYQSIIELKEHIEKMKDTKS